MSDYIGATYRNGGQIASALTTSFSLLNYGVTVDAVLEGAGLDSDNDGTFQNNTGSDITLNGTMLSFSLIGGVSAIIIFSAATSADKVNWNPQSSDTWQTFGRYGENYETCVFDYRITVPAGHWVGVVSKTSSSTATIYSLNNANVVYSNEGAIETPLISSSCSTVNNNNLTAMTSSGVFQKIACVTSEFPGGVGASQDNTGRITNTTGVSVQVFGFIYTKRAGFFEAIYLPYSTSVYKNGIIIPTAFVLSSDLKYNIKDTGCLWYYTTLAPGEYTEAYVRNTSGGLATYNTWSLEHTMRALK